MQLMRGDNVQDVPNGRGSEEMDFIVAVQRLLVSQSSLSLRSMMGISQKGTIALAYTLMLSGIVLKMKDYR